MSGGSNGCAWRWMLPLDDECALRLGGSLSGDTEEERDKVFVLVIGIAGE